MVMITIVNTHNHGIQLQSDGGPSGPETLTLGDLGAVVNLRAQLDSYLEKRGQTEYITTFNAVRLAKAEGYHIPTTTLTAACERGTIPNTRKLAGRWRMPKAEFETWYSEWKSKKDNSQ